jgi:hypothetical protein
VTIGRQCLYLCTVVCAREVVLHAPSLAPRTPLEDGVVSALRHDVRLFVLLPASSGWKRRLGSIARWGWPTLNIGAKALQHLPLEFAHRSISTTSTLHL